MRRGANEPELLRFGEFLRISVDNLHGREYSPVENLQESAGVAEKSKSEILQGTLDLLVLKTLDTLGPLHGFGIARRIEQVSGEALQMNQGTLYPALVRLEQRGWISSNWGVSKNNRRARFYALTKSGKKQLEKEVRDWEQTAAIIARVLQARS